MAIGKEIKRVQRLGLLNYGRYRRLRLRNRIFKVANLVGPQRRECPCCGWRGMRFLDFVRETATIEASVCPRCRSHSRHRALVLFIEELLDAMPRRARILHFAPEQAFARVFRSRPGLRYFGVDLGYRATTACADMRAIPFRSNLFDLVLSSHVLEHIEDDGSALGEIARVLAPAGQALIMVPMVRGWESQPTAEFGRADNEGHWRLYGVDFVGRIAAHGLDARIIMPAEKLSPAQRSRFAIREVPLFLATKLG